MIKSVCVASVLPALPYGLLAAGYLTPFGSLRFSGR